MSITDACSVLSHDDLCLEGDRLTVEAVEASPSSGQPSQPSRSRAVVISDVSE